MRRNRRAGVEDRWRKADGVRSANDGKGKRWRARYVDDEGKEHARSFTRKIDAQEWLNGITSTIVTGTYVAPAAGQLTVSEVHAQWAKSQGHLKATTVATRETTWGAHVRETWGPVAVAEVRTSAIRAWVAEMVQDGCGAATIENSLGVLRMTLNLAVEDRRIARNPCDGVKAPRRMHSRRGYLTHVQVEQLALAVDRNPEVIRFLAYTGLRWGEMAALRVAHFDMLRRRVNVFESVSEVKGKLHWSDAKTHERRSVPFPKFLVDELAASMVGKGRNDLVFTAPGAGVLRVSTYRPRVFKPAVAACQSVANLARKRELETAADPSTPEFPCVTPYDLRHTAASLAISAGANVKAVQTMLGHKSAALTLDTYADLFPDDLEAVANALDAAVAAVREATADALRTETQEGSTRFPG